MSGGGEVESLLEELFPQAAETAAAAEEEEEDDLAGGPECPRCHVPLEYAERPAKDDEGEVWSFFRCPKEFNGVRCYVVCGTAPDCQFHTYLDQVSSLDALNPVYLGQTKSAAIPFDNMECWCCQGLLLCMSKSEKNPYRLYFKCRSGDCDFFQWADQKPRGKAWKWLVLRQHRSHTPENRRKPASLQPPQAFPCKRPFEATPRDADVHLQEYIKRLKTKLLHTEKDAQP